MSEHIRMGDLCEIIADLDHDPPRYVGLECTVIGGLEVRPSFNLAGRYVDVPRFLVYLPQSPTGRLAALPCELRKKKPPTWEQCAWQPEALKCPS